MCIYTYVRAHTAIIETYLYTCIAIPTHTYSYICTTGGLPAARSPPGVSHDVCQSTALQELHHHPQLVAHQVAVVHLHHVLVLVVPHDHHLQAEWGGLGGAHLLGMGLLGRVVKGLVGGQS